MAESSLSEIPIEVAGTENSSVSNGVRGRNMAAPEVDKPLPVVELKPFTREVWRREKSFPEFYDKPITADGENGPLRMLQFDGMGTDITGAKDAATAATVISKFLERQRVHTSESRLADMTGPRYRIKMHPSIDFSYNCRPQKMNGLIPEFIPRVERTKSTRLDATRDDTRQVISEDMTERHQDMKIHGGRVTHTAGNPRTHLSYLNPLANYGQADTLRNNNRRIAERDLLSSLSATKRPIINGSSPSASQRKSSVASSDTSSVSDHVIKPRTRVPMKLVHNRLYKPVSSKQHVSVNIGGIRNALQILGDSGPPTKLERQLTFEMEVNLEKCRRHLELPPPDSTTHFPQTFNPNMFYDVNRTVTLTKGEAMLRQGRDLNRRRIQSRRHARGRPIPPVELYRNVRPAEAVEMDSGQPSPHFSTLEEAFYNGLFDRLSDSSPRSITYPNHGYQFSRGRPLNEISSKDNSNHTPTTDTSTIRADSVPRESGASGSIPRELAASDIRLDEVKSDDQMSPRTSCTSGMSPALATYITEPSPNRRNHVMSLDSRVIRDRKSVEGQTVHFSKAHFKPCNNVKFKDDTTKSECEYIRAGT